MLKYKSCWHAPGYRSLGIVMVDPDTGKEFQLAIGPEQLQRLINDCADAARQIGAHPPLDWERHPSVIYWPSISPWRAGAPKKAANAAD